MSKNAKILIILLAVVVLAAIYLLFNLHSLARNKQEGAKVAQTSAVDLKKMETDYKARSKTILADYEKLAEEPDVKEAQIQGAKSRLLDLKVPTQFKDLHINLVLAMVKMEDFLKTGDANEKIASQQMINQAKASYGWLN